MESGVESGVDSGVKSGVESSEDSGVVTTSCLYRPEVWTQVQIQVRTQV